MATDIHRILKDSRPFVISVETKGNKIFRGNLTFIEENMNCMIENAISIDQYGKISKFKSVLLRGSNIKIFIIPDILKKAPYIENL